MTAELHPVNRINKINNHINLNLVLWRVLDLFWGYGGQVLTTAFALYFQWFTCVLNHLDGPVPTWSPRTTVSNYLSARNMLITREDFSSPRPQLTQPIASLTGLPTRLSISTSASMVNLAVFLFTTSDTRGRETIRISAASACFS